MKKLFVALLCVLMLAALTACSDKKEETATEETTTAETTVEAPTEEVKEENCNVSGKWISVHDEGTDFTILDFKEDGSGSVTDTPYGTGLAFAYETDGSDIMTHMGSYEDETPMTYLKDSDQISYNDVIYNRLDETLAKVVGVWSTEFTEINQEYTILVFDADGTGDLTNMPMEIGLAFRYEINGDDILAHMGSADDNSAMTYLPDTDQISYNDVLYSRTIK